jgi:hypothetical protein
VVCSATEQEEEKKTKRENTPVVGNAALKSVVYEVCPKPPDRFSGFWKNLFDVTLWDVPTLGNL